MQISRERRNRLKWDDPIAYSTAASPILSYYQVPILFIWAAHFLDAFTAYAVHQCCRFYGQMWVSCPGVGLTPGQRQSKVHSYSDLYDSLVATKVLRAPHEVSSKLIYIFLHHNIFYGMPLMTTPTRGQSVNCSSIMTYRFHVVWRWELNSFPRNI